jgi:hypothetical protein
MHDQASPDRPGPPRHLAAVPIGTQASSPDPEAGYTDGGSWVRRMSEKYQSVVDDGSEPSGPIESVPYTLTSRAEFALGPPRFRLGLWQRMEAEDARQLLYQLAEIDAADLSPTRLAFTLGRLHGAAMNLLDIIDAITEP